MHKRTKPGLVAVTNEELRNSRVLDAFIAFHRDTFGGFRMDGDDDKDKDKDADKDKGGGSGDDKDKDKVGGSDKKVGENGNALDGDGKDLGYPANTPVADMDDKQQAAYHRYQARRHEERNKQLMKVTGGKTPDELKADSEELERLRNEKRSDSEKAVADAEKNTEQRVRAEFTPKLVSMAFDVALAHVDEADRKELIDNLDLSKFIDEAGDVDTAKVQSVATKISPKADKDAGKQRHDYGAGRRDSSTKSGVSAGRELFAATRKSKTSTDDS